MATRDALIDTIASRTERAYDTVARAAEAGGPPDADAAAAARALFQAPSDLQQVSVEEVSDQSGRELVVVKKVLDRFSIRPDGRTGMDLVRAFVDGRNPMAGIAVLNDPNRGYLHSQGRWLSMKSVGSARLRSSRLHLGLGTVALATRPSKTWSQMHWRRF